MSFLVFDIESRVDKALLRETRYRGETLSDAQAFERFRDELRRDGDGRSDFVPLSYHVPVSIVFGVVDDGYLLTAIEELRADVSGTDAIVRAFWERLEGFDGALVSFNGRGFDLPVLELHALRVGCSAPRYFGERDGFRSRFGRHIDLYEFLTNYGASRLRGGFDLVTRLIGLPGKTDVSGADVQGLWDSGRFAEIHRYCRRDVIETYYLLLHIERLRGTIAADTVRELEARTQPFRDELTAAS